ncbi:MAG: hypothetical protein A3D65_06310 [Candidatus Lloydbacteria bacterium RIFCSPHIGHO2_02_FULL_50_13]|uniref:Peptidase S1 domain-containing protein n=1 Tax=Candidatus Lloydbacteria bacterium RIFCSPHIGHO2_02_FULL_50_13 TaxID=1798661 RepID=A0A1G2D1C5_9BACT|nr:MAG: hypothetical protein A3D65_06310 [Candidatus Lloydbacteria bacterium RIFCSPHIGHO2_02_FULL_50_13]
MRMRKSSVLLLIAFFLVVFFATDSAVNHLLKVRAEAHNAILAADKEHPPVAPPPYVARVRITYHSGRGGMANAVLLESRQGLLLANAHITEDARLFEVAIAGYSFLAETREEWIDHVHDLSLLRIYDGPRGALPDHAPLADGKSILGNAIALAGYLPTGSRRGEFAPYAVFGVVEKERAAWGSKGFFMRIDVPIERQLIRFAHRHDIVIPTAKQRLLNDEFSVVWINCDGDNFHLQGGMSGSPILHRDTVAGILSGANECHGSIIPARAIKSFVEKVLARSAP